MAFLIRTLTAFFLLTAFPLFSWTPKDMMKMKNISDVQISPDCETVLFVATESIMTEDRSANVSRIYKSALNGEIQSIPFSQPNYTSTQPRWSPDGQWIAFLSNREGVKNLYLIRADGGEATALTKSKDDVQTFAWSPDGQKIAFVMTDDRIDAKDHKKTSLAYVYNQPTRVNRLWYINVFMPSPPIPLTTDSFSPRGMGDFRTIATEFDWSPDGQTIVFAHSTGLGLDEYHTDSSLASVDIPSGTVTPWEKCARYEAMPRYSPDGQQVAYVCSDSSKKYSTNRHIIIRSQEGAHPQRLASTYNGGPYFSGPNLLGWTPNGQNVLVFEPKGTKYSLTLLSADGFTATELDTSDWFFKDPVISHDRRMMGFVAQTPASPPEAYITTLEDFSPRQVSSLNQSLDSHPQPKTEIISWNSTDGLKIEGLLTYPIGYQEGKQYPPLLIIHGGPMAFFDETFLGAPNGYPLASFASEGFMILRPNPRGSCGYGKKFRCANYNDWGGMDYQDVMSGVEALIAKGLADPDRLGIMGSSYGGYLTAWAITQTTKFKAASIGAGLFNLVSAAGTTDLHGFLPDYIGDFIEKSAFYEERSPLYHVMKITTPCLIQHGVADKRVPVSQSYEFYHALERLGQKPTLVLYPGMEHHISDPKMLLDVMERNLAWFQKHLQP